MPLLNVNCRARRVLRGGGTSWSEGQERPSSRTRKMHFMQLGMKEGVHFACARACKAISVAGSPVSLRAACKSRHGIFASSFGAWHTTYKQAAKMCQKTQHNHNMHTAVLHRGAALFFLDDSINARGVARRCPKE